MKKFDLGQMIQILADIGVIVGIAFLAIEISQNTDAMRSQTVQSLQAEYREIFNFPDSYLVAISKDAADQTGGDRLVLNAFFLRLMRIFENQWYQYSRGFLDEELFNAYQQHMRITFSNPVFGQAWNFYKSQGFFHPGFVAHVGTFIEKNPPLSLLASPLFSETN